MALKIHFDKKNRVYRPGELLNGCVELILDMPKSVKKITIVITGQAKVKWFEGQPTIAYNNSEKYFEKRFNIYTSEINEKIKLCPGIYIFPFQYNLPTHIPPSFCDEFGKISYMVKATWDFLWILNKEVRKRFFVETLCDIRNIPKAFKPRILHMEKTFGIIFQSKPLKVVVRSPHSGIASGEIIPITFQINNEANITINYITLKLKCNYSYYSYSKISKKEEIKTLLVKYIPFQVAPKCTTSFNYNFKVPENIVLHNLNNCSFINCIYRMKIRCHTNGWTTDLKGHVIIYPFKN